MMDFANITQFGGALAALIPLVILCGLVFVAWRTASLHILVRRVWLLVHGNQEISDPAIRVFVDEQTSLMSFRMFSGVRASSLEEAHQLMQWAKLHKVELHKVGACGAYFDPSLRQVQKDKLPSRLYVLWHLATGFMCLVCALILLWLVLIQHVPLTLKATQRTFFATESYVQTLWPPPGFNWHRLRKDDCDQLNTTSAARTGFSEEERKVLCQLMAKDDWPKYVNTQLEESRWHFLGLAGFLSMLLTSAYFALDKVANAKSFLARDISSTLPDVPKPTVIRADGIN